MLEFVNAARPYLEALYFLAGIGLFTGVLIGYRQLAIIRKDIQTRNQRAAMENAIEACERYATRFVPLSGVFFDECRSRDLAGYSGPIGDFSVRSIPRELAERSQQRFQMDQWLPALNQLESIAASFVNGVADESTGFGIIGRTFCTWIEMNYDVIACVRKGGAHEYWANIVQLYQLWRPRLSKAELEAERARIDARIASVRVDQKRPFGADG